MSQRHLFEIKQEPEWHDSRRDEDDMGGLIEYDQALVHQILQKADEAGEMDPLFFDMPDFSGMLFFTPAKTAIDEIVPESPVIIAVDDEMLWQTLTYDAEGNCTASPPAKLKK